MEAIKRVKSSINALSHGKVRSIPIPLCKIVFFFSFFFSNSPTVLTKQIKQTLSFGPSLTPQYFVSCLGEAPNRDDHQHKSALNPGD